MALGIRTTLGLAILASVSFLFMLSHDIITQCDYFSAKDMVVSGTQRLSPKQILKQAQIHQGMNTLAVNLAIARKKLLAHPWIAEARIKREIPSQIHITITEHQPLAIVDLGRQFLINTDGMIFKEMETSDPNKLPIITGLRYSDIIIHGLNKRPSSGKGNAAKNTNRQARSYPFEAVLEVLHLGQQAGCILPNRLIKRIRVDREIGLILYTSDTTREIKLGYNNFSQKYTVLKKVFFILSDGKLEKFSKFDRIDLNNLNRVVINPSGIESTVKDSKEV
jgi:cell division protein FtsQ